MSKDTLAKRIIPCLDIKNGRVVKGVNFVGLQDAGNPIEVARRYNDEGADEITFWILPPPLRQGIQPLKWCAMSLKKCLSH